ncbi:splicing factor, proline- and glutamine-rich-like [Herpailurus yagouaroundi]|uniref:splicing factor, proline- and glutamine-rich-like n=1 Tax=Herpailurus yagouaroundi TaxID=1608482 RepID=UPI001AD6BF59|nr:splicing factor, proline- and glutamine-rich-like [Puma yagouaroundi]
MPVPDSRSWLPDATGPASNPYFQGKPGTGTSHPEPSPAPSFPPVGNCTFGTLPPAQQIAGVEQGRAPGASPAAGAGPGEQDSLIRSPFLPSWCRLCLASAPTLSPFLCSGAPSPPPASSTEQRPEAFLKMSHPRPPVLGFPGDKPQLRVAEEARTLEDSW